jgi:hypothetical protein
MTFCTPEKYREVPAIIGRELNFVSVELDRLKQEQIEKARIRRERNRNLSESIKTLQILCSDSGDFFDSGIALSHSELCEKSDKELLSIEEKISSELSLLAVYRDKETSETNLTPEHKEIRERLVSEAEGQQVSEWKLVNAALVKNELKSDRIDIAMAELDEMDFPQSRKVVFYKRLDAIYEEPSHDNRALKLDSLLIELATESREHKKRRGLQNELSLLKSQADALRGKKAEELSRQIEKAINTEKVRDLEKFLDGFAREIDELIVAQSVEQGREALIEALDSVGYRVTEGMNTAVVENGKLVVRKPAEEAYGVEVQSIAVTGKFQIRLVSGLPDSERSAKDDQAEEERWCKELENISQILDKSGIDLGIEKALSPGAKPVIHSSDLADILEKERRLRSGGKTRNKT